MPSPRKRRSSPTSKRRSSPTSKRRSSPKKRTSPSSGSVRFEVSPVPGKKYRAYLPDGKHVDFGAKGYQHYHDRIGKYTKDDHKDPKRRAAYRTRHAGVLLKDGTPAYKKKYTAAWFSWHYLW